MMKPVLFLLALLLCLPAAARANDDIMMRDSVYYTWDDGIMSKEEMEMEANDVYRLCDANASQKNIFKCECLAGSFLLQREKLGPTVPQYQIIRDITIDNADPSCANTDIIAGNSYTNCMNQIAPRRDLANDNEEYCTCISNKVARDFIKFPMMSPSYVRELTFNSIVYCEDPQNRAKKSAAKTAN